VHTQAHANNVFLHNLSTQHFSLSLGFILFPQLEERQTFRDWVVSRFHDAYLLGLLSSLYCQDWLCVWLTR
jgi:hypothetical protein